MRAFWIAGALLFAGGVLGCSKTRNDSEEARKRNELVWAVALDAGSARALGVSSRPDILFEEGFSLISYDPPDDFHNHAFRWMGQNGHLRVRAHGPKPMKVGVFGWVNEKVIRAKPVMSLLVNGKLIATTGAVEDGHFQLEAVVDPELMPTSWNDVNVTASAVGFHWADPPNLRVIVVYRFDWHEA